MKSFKSYVAEKSLQDLHEIKTEALDEGVLAGTVVATKLNSMRNRVKSERDLYKKIDLLADMVAFGTSAVAFATNYRGKKR